MMQSQRMNLSFLRGNSSACSGEKGWGWHQVPDSTMLGLAVFARAGSSGPTCVQEAQRVGWLPSGQLGSHWEGPLHPEPHPGRVKEGGWARDHYRQKGTSFRAGSQWLLEMLASEGRPKLLWGLLSLQGLLLLRPLGIQPMWKVHTISGLSLSGKAPAALT